MERSACKRISELRLAGMFHQRSPIIDRTDFDYQKANTIERPDKLLGFLDRILPSRIPDNRNAGHKPVTTRQAFLSDVESGMKAAPMSVRLTPHIMSVADWTSPFNDPIIRQFVPLKSNLLPDHPKLTLDSLHEEGDSPVPGLVHRYPDKVLFLGTLLQHHARILLGPY
jgi:lysine 2,3-aminomutase